MLAGGGGLCDPPRMKRPYVERLRVQNYGCVQDCELTLSPLHALVGPNDSGKSTLLAALETLGLLAAADPRRRDPDRARQLFARFGGPLSGAERQFGVVVAEATWRVRNQRGDIREAVEAGDSGGFSRFRLNSAAPSAVIDQGSPNSAHGRVRQAIAGATLLRLDPDALRAPAPLIPDGQPVRFADDRGRGLPAIYDALQTRDIQLIADLNRDLQRLFPAFKSLRLRNTDAQQKAIGAVLQDGTEVAASELSEGKLYYLALAALPHLDPTPLVLIEEPENGLHPARIADVMRVLRAVSETTQILMATHSPLVINELEGHEVSVITRDPKTGTQAVLLKDTPNYEARSKAYANGELWLNYCDGETEAPLVQGGPRP